MLQYVAVRCSVRRVIFCAQLHCVALLRHGSVFGRVLHCVAECCSVLQGVPAVWARDFVCSDAPCCTAKTCCSVLLCVAVSCRVLQCVAVCCGVLQCVAVSCSVLQCFAVCCSVLK